MNRSAALALCVFVALSGCGKASDDTAPRVGLLLEDGLYDSDLTAPFDVFQATKAAAAPGLSVCTIARSKTPVRTHEGLVVTPDFDFASAPRLEILVIPGAQRHVAEEFDDPELIEFVRTTAKAARFVMALRDGAFVLAKAGLLDGITCTTFGRNADELRKRSQKAVVVDNVSFVVDGKIITSVGGSRSYDPALYLVERLFGAEPARTIGQGLVVDWDLSTVSHLIHDPRTDPSARRAYALGERIDADVFVEDATGGRTRLLDIPTKNERVVVVVIFGGGANAESPPRAGLWCEDSLSEMGTLRHAIQRFAGDSVLVDERVRFIAIACPPMHHEARFGYEVGAFKPGGSKQSRDVFAAQTSKLVANGLLPFTDVFFDFEYRFLRNLAVDPATEAEQSAAKWIGRFRADGDAQEYGTPTLWILSRDGRVLAPPFHDNNWESGRPLRHTSRELEAAIARALEIA